MAKRNNDMLEALRAVITGVLPEWYLVIQAASQAAAAAKEAEEAEAAKANETVNASAPSAPAPPPPKTKPEDLWWFQRNMDWKPRTTLGVAMAIAIMAFL